MTNAYYAAALVIAAVMTMLTRALPFLLFRNKELPKPVVYLGAVLPASIMVILVVYCLRGINFSAAPFGLPELLAALFTVALQWWRKNTFLSIGLGTACYMVLIRLL